MAEYLVVSDAVAPISEGDAASAVSGLARALVAAKHRVTILSLAAPEHVARLPGMARRLRTVTAAAGGVAVALPLFEGQGAGSQLSVLGAGAVNPGQAAALRATGPAPPAPVRLAQPRG